MRRKRVRTSKKTEQEMQDSRRWRTLQVVYDLHVESPIRLYEILRGGRVDERVEIDHDDKGIEGVRWSER